MFPLLLASSNPRLAGYSASLFGMDALAGRKDRIGLKACEEEGVVQTYGGKSKEPVTDH